MMPWVVIYHVFMGARRVFFFGKLGARAGRAGFFRSDNIFTGLLNL